MALYAAAIFLSAFLLFQVQPVVAKAILPWFGGSASVWTTCLLFFQSVLLLGYLYAYGTVRYLRPGAQALLHGALLAASLAFLPVLPGAGWKPSGAEEPTGRILALLSITVGPPYLLLSATSPLLSAWFARAFPGRSPYRLFALSNAGSILALLSYPVLVEPFFPTPIQGRGWSLAYVAFCALCVGAALRGRPGASGTPGTCAFDRGEATVGTTAEPGRGDRLLWVALPACASVLLLAVTNQLTQNVAAIPFLWVLPLTLYLLTFILCFSRDGHYRRIPYLLLLPPFLAGMAVLLSRGYETARLAVTLPVFGGGLFVSCMVCHGEMARLKPHPSRLTSFYLSCSLGGALGGLFVAGIAPNLFPGYFELPAGLAACALLAVAVAVRDRSAVSGRRVSRVAGATAIAFFASALIGYLGIQVREMSRGSRAMVRNFYGGLRVYDSPVGGDGAMRTLIHGTITHGRQFLSPDRRRRPVTYYGPKSGIGLALARRGPASPTRVGVIGLGAGTLAAYGRTGDRYRFYDINPLVVRLAGTEFTFLRDTKAAVEIVPGDARLSLENEPPQNYDVLAVDAFSGDSIPVHLLTREAFALYFRHLSAGGVLAVHITNKHLDLAPVVGRLAASLGKRAVLVSSEDDPEAGLYACDWVLASDDARLFEEPEFTAADRLAAGGRPWTDDYSNLIRALK